MLTTGITFCFQPLTSTDRLTAFAVVLVFFTSIRRACCAPLRQSFTRPRATKVAAAKTLEEPMNQTMSLRDVAALLNVKPYRIEYLLANGIIPEPEQRIAGRRVFTPEIVRLLAARLKVTLPTAEVAAEAAVEPAGV